HLRWAVRWPAHQHQVLDTPGRPGLGTLLVVVVTQVEHRLEDLLVQDLALGLRPPVRVPEQQVVITHHRILARPVGSIDGSWSVADDVRVPRWSGWVEPTERGADEQAAVLRDDVPGRLHRRAGWRHAVDERADVRAEPHGGRARRPGRLPAHR